MKCLRFPYEWNNRTVLDHPKVIERAMMGDRECSWPNIAVEWTISTRSTLEDVQARASSYFDNKPHPTVVVMLPKYDPSRFLYSVDADLPLMGIIATVNFHEGTEYGSSSHSSATKDRDKVAEEAEEDAKWP